MSYKNKIVRIPVQGYKNKHGLIFVHLILIADSISSLYYIGLQVRLAARTLVSAPSSVFLLFGSGVLRANTVVVRMDP